MQRIDAGYFCSLNFTAQSCTAQFHCSISLLNFTAQFHCSISLLNFTAQFHCSISLLNFTAQFHCSISLLNSDFNRSGQPTAAMLLITYLPPVSLPLFQSCHNHRYPMLIRLTLATLICCITMIAARGETAEILFETDIKPLFTTKCGKCHREDERKGVVWIFPACKPFTTAVRQGTIYCRRHSRTVRCGNKSKTVTCHPRVNRPLTQQEQLLVQSWILAGSPSKTSMVKRRKLKPT